MTTQSKLAGTLEFRIPTTSAMAPLTGQLASLFITNKRRGFFNLRDFKMVSKNFKSESRSKDARSLSSLMIASPIPNSSYSEPDDAIVPPSVMVHLIVDQTEEIIPAIYSRQDYR